MSHHTHSNSSASASTDAGSRPAISSIGEAVNATDHRASPSSRLTLVSPNSTEREIGDADVPLDVLVLAQVAVHVTELLRTVERQESRLRALEAQIA